jgi:hypothetical protein
VVEPGFPKEFTLRSIRVVTMGPYRAYTGRGESTKLVKHVKKAYEPKWLEVLADIVADYLADATDDATAATAARVRFAWAAYGYTASRPIGTAVNLDHFEQIAAL